MSQVRPLIDGWIGYGNGASVLVETGILMDADHPVVTERPELFEAIVEPAVRRGRPPVKATPKPESGSEDG